MTRFVIAEDVAWVSRQELDQGEGPVAYVTPLPHGPAVVLQESACLVWLIVAEDASADGVTTDEVAAAAAELAELPVEAVLDDVAALLSQLVAAGVLRPH